MKYDVFISSKSDDFEIAEEVCNYLIGNGLNVFSLKGPLSRREIHVTKELFPTHCAIQPI